MTRKTKDARRGVAEARSGAARKAAVQRMPKGGVKRGKGGKVAPASVPPIERQAAAPSTKRSVAKAAGRPQKRVAATDGPPAAQSSAPTAKTGAAKPGVKANGQRRSTATGARGAKSSRRPTQPAARSARTPPAPVRVVRFRELDPVAKCGPGTSVEQLYRVDELIDGRPTVHLVFFDRHGWYCMHGASCAAVTDVKKELKVRAVRR